MEIYKSEIIKKCVCLLMNIFWCTTVLVKYTEMFYTYECTTCHSTTVCTWTGIFPLCTPLGWWCYLMYIPYSRCDRLKHKEHIYNEICETQINTNTAVNLVTTNVSHIGRFIDQNNWLCEFFINRFHFPT